MSYAEILHPFAKPSGFRMTVKERRAPRVDNGMGECDCPDLNVSYLFLDVFLYNEYADSQGQESQIRKISGLLASCSVLEANEGITSAYLFTFRKIRMKEIKNG